MRNIASMNPKLPSKCRDVSWHSPPTLSSKSFFQNDRPEPPPPPLIYVTNLVKSTSLVRFVLIGNFTNVIVTRNDEKLQNLKANVILEKVHEFMYWLARNYLVAQIFFPNS